ncbi:MAG: C25 family cysteine peptidase [Bacteroidota bacterium]
MKKFLISGVMLIAFFQTSFSDNLTFTFNFDDPVLKKNNKGYTEIKFTGCWNYGKEGSPSMPLYGAKILLPQNQEISSIKIIYTSYSSFTSGVVIQPAGKMVPISKPDKNYMVIPDADIYKLKKPYPENIISKGNTQFLSGHSIGLFTICPVIYLPADSMVKFLTEIKIEIETKTTVEAIQASKFLRNSNAVEKRINKIVYNPEDISNYSYQKVILGEYDLLLISNNALLPEFDEYVEFKTSTGYSIKTISVEDIYTLYPGADNQEKIRNCIIDYYQNKGIYYVILGGDADPNNPADNIIPHRGLTIADAYGYSEYDMPSDEYYSCLDGNWNNNGNIYWGEVGEFDLLAEVSIGRICVDNSTEILNQTNKLFMYQDEPVIADIEKTLMVGEELGWTMTGSDFMHEIETGSSNNGYTTVGIAANQTINTLYETASYSIAPAEIYNQFNNIGANLINHLGHAYTDYSMKFYNADVTTANFQNNGITRGFPIVYTQGCYSGAFDNRDDVGSYYTDDCIAENLSVLPTSVVATIQNSRYGWGDVDGTDGPSQRLHRQFVDAIFGENITQIGDVNRDSKDDNIVYSDTNSVVRWCDYEATLFGDPTMDIWTAVPTPIAASYPSTVIFGASDITFQTDAPNARIGLMQDGILIGRAITDINGDAIVTLISNISSVDTIFVSIIAHNRTRHKDFMTVASPTGPYVVKDAFIINDAVSGNNNGVADYGENITLSVTMKNIGIALAQSVNVFLSTTDYYVTITDSIEFYGDILPDSMAVVTDGYAFTVDDSIPDNHNVLFKVRATDGDSNWLGSFMISLKAPVLHAGVMTISDPAGNDNGRLDPGETVDLIISANNSGHSDALNTIGALASSSPYITINNASCNMNTLASMSAANATFNITVSPATPLASIVDFNFTVTSGYYSAQKTFVKTVGLVVEDWETGNFTNMTWNTSGNAPWIITSVNPYDGIYSAKSGTITDYQESVLELTDYNVPANDSVSFYRKVSSEAGWDYLQFFIDNSIMGQWSGEQNWLRVAYPLTEGTHTLKWIYMKDMSVSEGSDCAWIDDIMLPPFTFCSPTSGCNYGDMITQFILNDLNHNDTIGCVGDGYSDHTNRIATLALDNKYEVQAAVGYANEMLSLWIDFNNNNIFGLSELLLTDMNITAANVLTSDSIEIPAGANTGYHRMRVRIHRINTSTDPCVAFDYGETHDYLVNIIDNAGINEPASDNQVSIFPNPSEGTVNIMCSDVKENPIIRLCNIQGQVLYEDIGNWPSSGIKQMDISKLAKGVYYLEIINNEFRNSYKVIKI